MDLDKKRVLIFIALTSFMFLAGLAFAAHTVTLTNGGTSTSINESVVRQYTIWVNNTDAGGNISQVNMSLPSTFTFVAGSNITTAAGAFVNTTTILSWENTTGDAKLVGASYNYSFIFNASASTPGNYNITVMTTNSTATIYNNISVTVNDSLAPSAIEFSSPTPANGVNVSLNYVFVNVSVTDTGTLNTITIRLYNASNATVYQLNATDGTSSPFAINFTGLADGNYTFNVTANDSAGNSNKSETRTINLDTTIPSSVEYISAKTTADGVNLSNSGIGVNISAADARGYLSTIIIRLYNSTHSQVNSSSSSLGVPSLFVNFTGHADGVYYFNASANDTAGNSNTTVATSRIVVDTTLPVPSFSSPTLSNGDNVRNNLLVNVSVTETNIDWIIIRVYNSTGDQVNISQKRGQTNYYVNITDLGDGSYLVNATANDSAGNSNKTETRNITIDNVPSSVEYSTNAVIAGANLTYNNIAVNITATDAIMMDRIVIYLYNISGLVNSSISNSSPHFINFTGLADGRYYVNATVNDSIGNRNSTVATRSILIDTVAPIVSYVTPSTWWISSTEIPINISTNDSHGVYNITIRMYNSTHDLINITSNNSISILYNITALSQGIYYINTTTNDTLGNVNTTSGINVTLDTTNPAVSLTKTSTSQTSIILDVAITEAGSGISNCSVDDTSASITGSGNAWTVTSQSTLNCGTSHSYTVTCADKAGNTDAETIATSTEACSRSSGGGGGGSTTTTTTWSTTYTTNEENLKTGYIKTVGAGERIKASIAGEIHYVGVTSITADSAIIEVSSTPQTATLKIGETKKFDVSDDSIYDLSITLNSVTGNKATLKVISIQEEVALSPVTNETAVTGIDGKSNILVWTIVVILLVIIIAIVKKLFFKKSR